MESFFDYWQINSDGGLFSILSLLQVESASSVSKRSASARLKYSLSTLYSRSRSRATPPGMKRTSFQIRSFTRLKSSGI